MTQQYNAQIANDRKDVVAKYKKGEVELAQIRVRLACYVLSLG